MPDLFKKLFLLFFRLLENLATIFMSVMVLGVFLQVVLRNVFSYGLPWTDEIATLMMVWFGFLGISIGVLERIHMSIEVFTMKFSEKAKDIIIRGGYVLIAFFGCLMVWYGIQIIQVTKNSTMPATQWPSLIVYIVLPLSGILVLLNSFLVVFHLDKVIIDLIGKSGEARP
ncbi:MAG: TRAP transporter small permease [Spirochaetales bacterium]|jgi:TRAP-type C4-dicarboxylate transport system permease small subunit|nr:TRAP transporter small permease [Spirochaetales bacterium]